MARAGTLCAALFGVDVVAKDGVHAGEVTFAARPEPLQPIAIEAQINGGLAAGLIGVSRRGIRGRKSESRADDGDGGRGRKLIEQS